MEIPNSLLSIQAYCADPALKYHAATITDFKNIVNTVTGQDYSWYFNDWIYQPNHPLYQNSYQINDLGNGQWQVQFTANQVQSNPAYFRMLLEIKVRFADNTSVVETVMNNTDNEVFTWTYNKKPEQVFFDPDNEIVLKTATLHKILTISGAVNPVCSGTSVTLDAGLFNSYSWNTGATTRTITVTPATTTTYSVTVTETGFPNQNASATVTVNPLPVPVASSNSPVNEGATLNLSCSPDGLSSYAWTGPNGFTSNLQNPSIPGVTASAEGTYTVIATSSGPCSASSSVTVDVATGGGPYYTISGTLKYNNLAKTPMNNVTLTIFPVGATSITDAGGNYSFGGLLARNLYHLGN